MAENLYFITRIWKALVCV